MDNRLCTVGPRMLAVNARSMHTQANHVPWCMQARPATVVCKRASAGKTRRFCSDGPCQTTANLNAKRTSRCPIGPLTAVLDSSTHVRRPLQGKDPLLLIMSPFVAQERHPAL